LIRASTPLFPAPEGVDGRAKPGQGETGEPISFLLAPQDFPRTALRKSRKPGPDALKQLPPVQAKGRLWTPFRGSDGKTLISDQAMS
jgi:hypothetical protein